LFFFSSRRRHTRSTRDWSSDVCSSDLENDSAYKQIIPYVLLAFQDRVLHYVRGKKAGEQRLVAKGSIGIGGHMNESDESLFAWEIGRASCRERVSSEGDVGSG